MGRPAELTPRLDLAAAGARAGPDIDTLLDPANDVAYKMIGGAYGVLGAEVLGYYVPRAPDEARSGIYVREAGIAWLCSRVAPQLGDHPRLQEGLALRLARGVAAHHHVHLAIEAAVTEARGTGSYLELLAEHVPRHEPLEELLGELMFRSEVLSGLEAAMRGAMVPAMDAVLHTTPEGPGMLARADATSVVALVNARLSLEMTLALFQPQSADRAIPQFLVLEPHLPQPVASAIRGALLG